MAVERDVQIARVRESTRRIECECPYGGPNTLTLYRESAALDSYGNVAHLSRPWREIHKGAADIAPMTFTRLDGSTFTGAQLMADMQVACDQIAAE